MELKRYKPRTEKRWETSKDGSSFTGELYTEHGLVSVFIYYGGEHGPGFTTLEMWRWPYAYHVRLPHGYHRRWVHRVARDFAWEVEKWAEEPTS